MIHLKLLYFKCSLARTLFPATSRVHLRNRLWSSRSTHGVKPVRLVAIFTLVGPIFDVADDVRASRGAEKGGRRSPYLYHLALLTLLFFVIDAKLDSLAHLRARLRRILEEVQGLPLMF